MSHDVLSISNSAWKQIANNGKRTLGKGRAAGRRRRVKQVTVRHSHRLHHASAAVWPSRIAAFRHETGAICHNLHFLPRLWGRS